jgi:hypothetical protein
MRAYMSTLVSLLVTCTPFQFAILSIMVSYSVIRYIPLKATSKWLDVVWIIRLHSGAEAANAVGY